MTAREWTLQIKAPARMLSANGNKPWRETANAKREWRAATYVLAKSARLPRGLDRVRVDVELWFNVQRERDEPNYHPYVAKPIVDALAAERKVRDRRQPTGWRIEPGYGLIPNDTKRHLDGPHIHIGHQSVPRREYPHGLAVVTITDLNGDAHA